MKRNLFAIFLAVMLVAALVFFVTPDAKAAGDLITVQENGETITVSAEDTVLNLNGKKNVVVKIENNVELSVIDTSFKVDEETLDLTGNSAGTLTVDAASTGTIAPVAFYGDFRYLAVETGGTYSFHPFNLAISKLGINTIGEAVCIQVTFIANDVVKAKLTDYGIKSVSGEAEPYSAKEKYQFGSKNGILAYFDLKGSFNADKLDVTVNYQAYMIIDGVDVLSNYIAEVTPRAVLKTINKNESIVSTATATQKEAIKTIAANNAHLADLFTSITGDACTHNAMAEATCLAASTCKNCDVYTVGTTVDHKDTTYYHMCDWCGTALPVEDYYAFGPEEFILAKTGTKEPTLTYIPHTNKIDEKDVYALNCNGWYTGEIWAEATSHYLNGSQVCYPSDVRAELNKKQFKYIAITFQLSDKATIGLYHTVPTSDKSLGDNAGFVFTADGTLTQNGRYVAADHGDRFAVYSNGAQVKLGDPIYAGQWYTFVCELNMDTSITLNGASTYVNVSMTNGNNKPVYVSEVRYYTNDSYKTDYVLPDYDEKDSSELVVYKSQDASQNAVENYDEKDITFNGRTNVYGVTFPKNSWYFRLAPKSTVPQALYADSAFADWNAVRSFYVENGYQYIAIDFALAEGASINVVGSVPIVGTTASAYLTFTDGSILNWKNTYTDEQKAYFVGVYSNGAEVNIGTDTVEASQWYTVVLKLLTEVDVSGRYSNVGFEYGTGEIYFSNVRYYRNDSYKTDYIYETVDPDYDEKDVATELVSYTSKTVNDALSNQGTTLGRNDVYGATFLSNWSVEVAAKNTASTTLYTDAPFDSWDAVRNNFKAQGYQYITIDFALSEGATICVAGSVPLANTYATAYLKFTDDGALTWYKTDYTDEQKSYFTVYSNGEEVKPGDTISAGQWYTVVVKLLTDAASSRYSSVAFNAGNGKMVYFSDVRYYRNDSFTTDFAG